MKWLLANFISALFSIFLNELTIGLERKTKDAQKKCEKRKFVTIRGPTLNTILTSNDAEQHGACSLC